VFGDKCLEVPEGSGADGTKVQISSCSTDNANQKWGYTVRLVSACLILVLNC